MLSAAGARVAARLLAGSPLEDAEPVRALARRLVDAGLAHPAPPSGSALSLAVVVPSYDAAGSLDRCLRALSGLPVTVVDDGSPDATAIAEVAAAHGAALVRLAVNAGPGAARNAGVAASASDVVAFVDADVAVSPLGLQQLAAHFADPGVVAVAPRIRPARLQGSLLSRFAAAWSPLDLGGAPSLVAPGRGVPYVPSAVLLVRRSAVALDAEVINESRSGRAECAAPDSRCVDQPGQGWFDPELRHGEDVDLVWRLVAAGGRVRYDPSVVARHDEPSSWATWLHRRFRYGTSAAPLHARHGDAMAPLRVSPAPTAAVLLALAGRRKAAVIVLAATLVRVEWRMRRSDVISTEGATGTLVAPFATWLGLSRWATQLAWPAVVAGAVGRGHRRLAVASAVAPPLVEWAKRRPAIDPLRWTLALWADDVAYGLGVWRSCLRERTLGPLLPRLSRGAR